MINVVKRINRHSPEIFKKEPIDRNEIAYIPQFLSQGSLPKLHKNESEFKRASKSVKYTLLSPSEIGVPGGSYSRLILILFNTLAKHAETPTIKLGNTKSKLMHSIGLGQHGDENKKFKKHFLSCINCVFHIEDHKSNTTKYSIQSIIKWRSLDLI